MIINSIKIPATNVHPKKVNKAQKEIVKLKGIVIIEGKEVNKKFNFSEST